VADRRGVDRDRDELELVRVEDLDDVVELLRALRYEEG